MRSIRTCTARTLAALLFLGACGDDASADGGPGGSEAGVDASRRDAGASREDASRACDEDGDGEDGMSCGGLDCDDTNAARSSASAEVCDDANVDEDCDPFTFGSRDGDEDGFIDDACCNDDGEMLRCGTDCDDVVSSIYDGAPEVCNGRNDDCDEATDEGVTASLCRDGDGDLHGEAAMTMVGCPGLVAGHVAACDDCDDTAAGINPGVPDNTCDGVDNDCDRAIDEAHPDESCDGVDNDCDGVRDNGLGCVLGATESCRTSCGSMGMRTCIAGCTWSSCAPPAETCNGRDDDCDLDCDDGAGVCCAGAVSGSVNACGNGFLPCDVTCNSTCAANQCVLGGTTWSFGATHAEVRHACGVASGWGPTSWESVGACADLAHGPVGAPATLGWRLPPGNYDFTSSVWCPDDGCTFRVTLYEIVRGTGLIFRDVAHLDVNDARTYPGRTVAIPHRVDTCDATYWLQVDFNGPGLGVVHDFRVEKTDGTRLDTWL